MNTTVVFFIGCAMSCLAVQIALLLQILKRLERIEDKHMAKMIIERCPQCESDNITREEYEQEFIYGVKNPVTLKATMPLFVCKDCGFQYYDYRGEEARQKAVDQYLSSRQE